MNKFRWLKAFISPFKRPKLYWYIGRVAIGTPYFFPRRWINNKEKRGYMKAIPRKIGFDFVALGWKTKWDSYRHEWNPIWSFVFFKWQIAVKFIPKHDSHYWESWLYYELDTDKSKSRKERITECREKAPQLWSTSIGGVKDTTDYYTKILKPKYL